MGEMAEDRVYADHRGKTDVYIGSELGLTLVAISDDRVGRFRLVRRGQVRALAADDDGVVIGGDDVYRADNTGDEHFQALGFGPAAAVEMAGPIAMSPDGEVARYDGAAWHSLGTVDEPAAIAGEWIAAGDGLYRITGETIERRGPPARDVTGGSNPIAATDDGIARYTDGEWTHERRGAFHAVARRGANAHAVGERELLEYSEGEWIERSPPTDERIVDLGYGQGIVAVTAEGTVLVDPPAAKDGAEGWRSRSLGLAGVSGLAIADARV